MASTLIITGLDIGTTKVSAVVAEVAPDGGFSILGIGESPSSGLRQGNLIHLESTIEAVRQAVGQAEKMAGTSIRSVYANIGGDHIRSINSRGVIAVSGRDSEVTQDDIQRVVEAARALAIPSNRAILHVIPQEFIVDDQTGITDPVGMSGVRLEAEVHIITASATAVRNIVKCIERAGCRVEELVAEPLASAWSVLEEDERRLGVVLLDIGAGTTDVAVYFGGSVHHTAVISMGGAQITNDIAIGLRTPLDTAEQIKIEHGCAFSGLLRSEQKIAIPGVGGRESRAVSVHVLAAIIEPRVEEILTFAREEVERLQGNEVLAAGTVVTGGSAGLRGVTELVEQVFEMPTRIGVPFGAGGVADLAAEPRCATGVGLARYGGNRYLQGGAPPRWQISGRWREWVKARVPFFG
jgi:cell division protein FtsA